MKNKMESDKRIYVLTIKYKNDIKQHEVPLFRGAVNAAMGDDGNVLFHNHTDRNYRYSYPLIQYKRLGGKAAIVCVNEGADEMGKVFAMNNSEISLCDRNVILSLDKVETDEVELEVSEVYYKHRLESWIPFRKENYNAYLQIDTLLDKIVFLQRILIGNILSMAKGLGITVEGVLDVQITACEEPKKVKFKGVNVLEFDVEFITNTRLPVNVGIGKGVSLGHGVITRF